jgi:uncharacterized iron-regulated membrane protein
MEHVSTLLISLFLLAVAIFFAWRQWRTMRWLKTQTLSAEDVRYYRRRSIRRLLGCAVMIVLAGLIGGLYFLDTINELDRLIAKGQQAQQDGAAAKLTEEEAAFLRFWFPYVGAIVCLLLVLMIGAVMDMWATRKYSFRHRKALRESSRAQLEAELAELRRQRPPTSIEPSEN